MSHENVIAEAIGRVVTASRVRRVPLRELLVAAASVDRTGSATVGWRARVLAAITELADQGLVTLPTTREDRTAHPPLPAYVTRIDAPRPEIRAPDRVVWHLDLDWVGRRADEIGLSKAEHRFLTAVNAWWPRRGGDPVPMRERSLEIFGDEKELERWVFGPLFGSERPAQAGRADRQVPDRKSVV